MSALTSATIASSVRGEVGLRDLTPTPLDYDLMQLDALTDLDFDELM